MHHQASRFSVTRILSISAALIALADARAATPELGQLVPHGAAFFVAVDDMPQMRREFDRTAFGMTWDEPELVRFLAPFQANPKFTEMLEKLKEETGRTPAELLDFVTGDVLLTVPASSFKLTQKDADADALLLIEVGENQAKILEFIAQQQAKIQADGPVLETTEDYNGVTLHLVKPKPEPDATPAEGEPQEQEKTAVWALHDGRWLIATERGLVTGALDAMAAGGLADSLANSTAYTALRAGQEAGRPGYAARVDFKALYPALVASIEASRDPQQAPNPMGLDPLNIINALGLDALDAFSASGHIEEDGAMRGVVSITYTEARGIVNLLAYRDGPVTKPDWVPANWINVSTQNFSMADVYNELEGILDRISPMLAGMALGQVRAFDRQLKIDLKRDLVGNIGPAMVSAVAMPPESSTETPAAYDEVEQFFAFALADSAAFERTLDALKERFFPAAAGPVLESRDYLERKIHVMTPQAGAQDGAKGFAYAITDGWFLMSVGSAAPVETAIQGMAKADAATSFWARPDMRAGLEEIPAGAVSVQATDLRVLLASLCALAVKAQAANGDEESKLVDPDVLPSVEVFSRHLGPVFGFGERRPDGLYFHGYLPASKATTAPSR
jgi:hypothetical protein